MAESFLSLSVHYDHGNAYRNNVTGPGSQSLLTESGQKDNKKNLSALQTKNPRLLSGRGGVEGCKEFFRNNRRGCDSNGCFAPFTGSDANDFLDRQNKDLAVTDLAAVRGLTDTVSNRLGLIR
jgi:hypothetical protein